jgi:hypothetical protein
VVRCGAVSKRPRPQSGRLCCPPGLKFSFGTLSRHSTMSSIRLDFVPATGLRPGIRLCHPSALRSASQRTPQRGCLFFKKSGAGDYVEAVRIVCSFMST